MSARRGCPLSNRCGRPRTGTEACPYIPIGLVCGSDIYAPRSWLLYDDANGCAAERLIGRDDPKEMKFRKTNRMREYDYSRPGHYFVTICVQGRKELFGEIINDRMMTNAAGAMVEETWRGLPKYYRGIQMDEFQAMPNHVHGIIVITGNEFHHRTVGTGRDLSGAAKRDGFVGTGLRACPCEGQPRGWTYSTRAATGGRPYGAGGGMTIKIAPLAMMEKYRRDRPPCLSWF